MIPSIIKWGNKPKIKEMRSNKSKIMNSLRVKSLDKITNDPNPQLPDCLFSFFSFTSVNTLFAFALPYIILVTNHIP